MKKVFLDDLPRSKGKNERIDWTKSEGMVVRFEYGSLVGEILINLKSKNITYNQFKC